MKIVLLVVGRMRDRHLGAVCDDYVARIARYVPVEVVEVPDDEALVRRIPPQAEVIALEPGGESWNTVELTRFVEDRMVHGARAIVFLVGGSDGLPKKATERAQRRLSLSPLTLPHRIARLVLCEQLYRALSIIKGEPYNR